MMAPERDEALAFLDWCERWGLPVAAIIALCTTFWLASCVLDLSMG